METRCKSETNTSGTGSGSSQIRKGRAREQRRVLVEGDSWGELLQRCWDWGVVKVGCEGELWRIIGFSSKMVWNAWKNAGFSSIPETSVIFCEISLVFQGKIVISRVGRGGVSGQRDNQWSGRWEEWLFGGFGREREGRINSFWARGDDGAVYYDQLIDEWKKKQSDKTGYWSDKMKKDFVNAPHWSIENGYQFWQKVEDRRKDFNIAWIQTMLINSCTFDCKTMYSYQKVLPSLFITSETEKSWGQ